MSVEKLKPCPFCGGEAVVEGEMAYCDGCDATIATEYSPKKAIKAWNTREIEDSIILQDKELRGRFMSAVQTCIDVYKDFSDEEIEKMPVSIQEGYKLGKLFSEVSE